MTTRAPTCRWKRRIKPPGACCPARFVACWTQPFDHLYETRCAKHKTTNRARTSSARTASGRFSTLASVCEMRRVIALRKASRSGHEPAAAPGLAVVSHRRSTRFRRRALAEDRQIELPGTRRCTAELSRGLSVEPSRGSSRFTISSRNGTSSMTFLPPRIVNRPKSLSRKNENTWVTASRLAFSPGGACFSIASRQR